MRLYETLFIVKANQEEEAIKANIEKFTGIIEKNGGEIVEVDEWGKRRLAYPIQKITEGYYTLVNFKADSELPKELARNFKISDDVIRHIIIKKEDN